MDTLSPEEMIKKLREAGISVGTRVDTKAKSVKSPLIEKHRKGLQQLTGLLEDQIKLDQMKMSELHAALQKLKHGGGS